MLLSGIILCVLLITLWSFYKFWKTPYLHLIKLKRIPSKHLLFHTPDGPFHVQVFDCNGDSTVAKNAYFRLVRSYYTTETKYGVNDWMDNYVTGSNYSALLSKIGDKIVTLQMPKDNSKATIESYRSMYLKSIQKLV